VASTRNAISALGCSANGAAATVEAPPLEPLLAALANKDMPVHLVPLAMMELTEKMASMETQDPLELTAMLCLLTNLHQCA